MKTESKIQLGIVVVLVILSYFLGNIDTTLVSAIVVFIFGLAIVGIMKSWKFFFKRKGGETKKDGVATKK